MKQAGRVLVFGLLSFGGLLLPQSTAAATISSTGNPIQITATVLPSRYVVVDKTGEIKQILNNNSVREIAPQVYLNAIAAGNELPLTADISAATERILDKIKIEPGIIYERPLPTVARKQVTKFPLVLLRGAGAESRTPITSLENWDNNRYTTPAWWVKAII